MDRVLDFLKPTGIQERVLSDAAVVTIQVIWTFQALSRGSDLVWHPNPPGNYVIAMASDSAPLTLWGWALIIGAGLVLSGIMWTRLPLASLGHLTLFAVYVALGVGALVDSMTDTIPGGYRSGTSLLAAGALHALYLHGTWRAWFCTRTGHTGALDNC